MKDFLIKLASDYSGEFLVGIFTVMGSIVGGILGYYSSTLLARNQRAHEDRVRRESYYLKLLGEFNAYNTAYSAALIEMDREIDPIKKEKTFERTKEIMLDFSKIKAIVELIGTDVMNSLVEEINKETQNMSLELNKTYRETGRTITNPRDLISGKNFFSKKTKLIDEIRKNLDQPISKK